MWQNEQPNHGWCGVSSVLAVLQGAALGAPGGTSPDRRDSRGAWTGLVSPCKLAMAATLISSPGPPSGCVGEHVTVGILS